MKKLIMITKESYRFYKKYDDEGRSECPSAQEYIQFLVGLFVFKEEEEEKRGNLFESQPCNVDTKKTATK